MKKKYVIAYMRDGGLETITEEDAKKLTHVNLAFGKIDSEGKIYTKLKNLNELERIRKYNPEIKFLISLGGWGNGGFSEAAMTEESRKFFNEEAIRFMKEHKLDGIDIDWEYPTSSISGITSSPKDKEKFTLLLKDLREALDKEGKKDNRHYLLTIAAGADEYFIRFTNMKKAQKYLDYVMLMTYDFRGGFQILTGHHTNLGPTSGDIFPSSIMNSVKLFKDAGVPSEKLLIGSAFYSRSWTGVPNVNNGYLQMAQSTGGISQDFTDLDRDYINKNGYTRYWDDEAKAPYLFNGDNFISYDDEESISHKSKYVKDNNLRGIMFWLYDADKTGKLLNAIHEGLK